MPRIPLRSFYTPTISHTIPQSLRCYQSSLRSPRYPLRQPFPRLHNFSTQNSPPPPDAPRPADLRSQLNVDPVSGYSALPPKPKRSLRRYIYMTFFLAVGLYAGNVVWFMAAPPPLPLPGSKADTILLESIKKKGEQLPIVKSLTEDPNWTYYDAYEALAPEDRGNRLSTGPLGGGRALGGFQRIFYNAETGECVTVVFVGGALAGWPTSTHGGALATILDESMGRCAIRKLPGHTGVTASLYLLYFNPVHTNSFYVIRATPVEEGSTDKKQNVHANIENLDGQVLVGATGLFVVPKNYKTQPLPRM